MTEANHRTGVLLHQSAALVTHTPAHAHSLTPAHNHAHTAYTAHSNHPQNAHPSPGDSPRVSPSHHNNNAPPYHKPHSNISHNIHPPSPLSHPRPSAARHATITSALTNHSVSSILTNCAHTEATSTALANAHNTQVTHSCYRDVQVCGTITPPVSKTTVCDTAPAHTPSTSVHTTPHHHQPHHTNVPSHFVPDSQGPGQVNQLGASPPHRAAPEVAPTCPADPLTGALLFSSVIALAPSIIESRPPPGHRVTFHLPPRHMNIPPDSSSENGNGNENVRVDADDESSGSNLMVRCRNPGCGQMADTEEARRSYKMCHNCCTFYCSRGCRRHHWERHKRQCNKIRALAVAKQVTARVKDDDAVLERISAVARRGARALGRGTVKVYFHDTKAAETFVGGGEVPEAHYLTIQNLLPQETGPEVYKQITDLCKHYNTEYKFVLYVSICIMSEIPTGSSPKWEREVVSQCAKLRLAGGVRGADTWSPRPERHVITRDLDEPETLILTSAPIPNSNTSPQAARHIAFNNIVRHLRERGISLRHQYPDVHRKLTAYVEAGEVFPPLTIYPRDPNTGSTFMCIIMPETDHAKLQLLSNDASKVRTIDISRPHPPT
ncbi:Apical junction component 1-like [Homarus americanus]|uniref:Apical junction component 1-like n=2 Tax=Homarus americanus TaxID=6706 RepID=A0A8J5MK50_HOMAM|nr:Apical junction component 1-like [Homarus americanus]